MKKTALFCLILLAFAFFACKEESGKAEIPPTLDQRLVGGRWYFPHFITQQEFIPDYSYGYYEFIGESTFIYSEESSCGIYYYQFLGKPSYSKDGKIYLQDIDLPKPVMQYEFHDKFPFQNTDRWGLLEVKRFTLDRLAAKGDLITYNILSQSGGVLDVDRFPNIQSLYLVRFNDY